MIIFLYGADTFRSRQKLKFYREGFKKKYDPQGFNIEVLAGEKLKLEDLRNKLGNKGLLSKKKLVVIEDLMGKNKKEKIQKEVVKYLKENKLSQDEVLIFWEGDIENQGRGKKKRGRKKVSPLQKYLAKEAKVEDFGLLKGYRLKNWTEKEIRKRGGRIEPVALDLLLALVGQDLWQMNNEIEKLINYKKGKVINKDDVSLFVKTKYDTDIFKLTDALAEKKKKLALKLIRDQIMSGENELYLLAMLSRLFRILVQVKEVSQEESNYYTIANRLNLHPFVAKKSLVQTRNFKFKELKNIYQQLLDIDLKIKTSQAEPRVLFDLFIFKVCNS
ncbi:MAG: DNA polymerase III subunit delta [Patescibacteria group bacterium]|nr:DNA polymerase III subunit delta [Patescibacteria group bacterium]